MFEWLALSKIAITKAVERNVEKMVDRGWSFVESEVTRFRNVEEEMDRLRRTCERINSLLIDAEERRYIEDQHVINWLRELRSISFDSDTLLGEYQTALNIHKHNRNSSRDAASSSRKRKHFQISMPSLSLSPEWGPLQRRKFSMAIDGINQRLAHINESRRTLRLRGADGARRQKPGVLQPASHYDPAKIVGRDSETKYVIDLLESDGVVAIHGAAGIGKTTLAKKVCNEIGGEFRHKIWVSLSGNCDSMYIAKEILKQMTNQHRDPGSMDMILNSIRDHLKQLGSGEPYGTHLPSQNGASSSTLKQSQEDKILLAIDNWPEGFHLWQQLQAALLASKKEIKVLITTRNEKTCLLMTVSRYHLKGLNEDECFELLSSLAGIDKQNEIFEPIGKNIASRCGGSPMAAKILGAHLRGQKEEEWTDVLSEMRTLRGDQNEVMPSLKISYHHLPYQMKLCYSYCSIFPHGYKFEKDQVIRYWLAEGMIQPEGRRRLEAVGSKYFYDLVWRSFFEKALQCDKNRVEYYKIPSLMYDLARDVSQYEFVELETGTPPPSTSPAEPNDMLVKRYCSLFHPTYNRTNQGDVKIEHVCSYLNLRALKICGEDSDGVPLNLVSLDLFWNLKCLRVLDLSNTLLKILPDSIGELIHVRYLGLANTKIEKIPEKLSDLFNLQTLDVKGCLKLGELPQGMRKLVSLRHLDLRIAWEEITDSTKFLIPQGIRELESLQTLFRFNVPSDTTKGESTINELKDLNLRGDLCLLNLENIETVKNAKDANLQGKQFIENLMLRWSESPTTNRKQHWSHSKNILESLQPNNRIRCLWIMNYPCTSFPDWIGESSFTRLEMVKISNSYNFKFLRLLGQLPRLKHLHIENIKAKTIGSFEGFQSLEHLTLLNLQYLKKLCLERDMPTLRKVNISECPNLQDLIIHREVYTKLERRNCTRLTNIICVPQD